jgi:hypothetical protein
MPAPLRRRHGALVVLMMLLLPLTVHAGMTMPEFSEIARTRLQVLSFFLILYLLTALVYQWAWNSLRKDFPKLPRIRYTGALAALAVCGLFIYVVLTMISGARELMTPGAWARTGVSYKLREPEKDPKPWLDASRRASLEKVRAFLWRYASEHGGAFPARREQADIPPAEWRSIDPDGLPLVYIAGLKPDIGKDVLVYEPVTFGRMRFVLLSSGEIVSMEEEEVTRLIKEQLDAMDRADSKQAKP